MKFSLPELGEGVHEGELVKWRVKAGDVVKHDQPLCDVMTDKATIEIPAPFDGKISEILAKEGEIVKVGQALVDAEVTGGKMTVAHAPAAGASPAAPASAAKAPSPASSVAPAAPAAAPAMSAGASLSAGPVSAAPSTRRMARELGVEISRVPGSGPHGRIMREDVERFGRGGTGGSAGAGLETRSTPATYRAPGGATATGGETRVPFKGLRKKISEKMRLSKDNAAHFTYVEEADATELVRLRAQAKEIAAQQGVKLTYLPFIMKAMVSALRQYPILNSTLDEAKGELVYKHYYNIGLSVQTDDGLTAPVIKDVEHKSILEIARDIQAVVDRARTKRLTLDDLQGGTITLTNAGSIGGLFATPIINYPEVSILGFNKIFRKPVAKTIGGAEQILVRDWTYFSISLDHRVVDGAIGAEFMKLFVQYIENPNLLLLETL